MDPRNKNIYWEEEYFFYIKIPNYSFTAEYAAAYQQ